MKDDYKLAIAIVLALIATVIIYLFVLPYSERAFNRLYTIDRVGGANAGSTE
jgi:hypothetical protein